MSIQKALKHAQKYVAAPGAGYSNQTAQTLGEYLTFLEQSGIPVTPPELVKHAEPADSPIHKMFEWDQAAAAHNFRIHQARNYINHLRVVVTSPDGEYEVKACFSVKVMDSEECEPLRQQYVNIRTVQVDPELRLQVYNDAMRELRAFTEKYSAFGLTEFAPVYEFVRSRSK